MPGPAIRVLFWNTFLLHVGLPAAGPLARLGPLHAKPLVPQRAREVGGAVRDTYDVVCLAEVFGAPEVAAVLGAAGVDPADAVAGPPASPPQSVTSSGLLSFARLPVVRTQHVRFRNRGRRLLDSDAWAAKGVLLVEVDVGQAGNLEVYSTHLFYGGDLLRSDARHRSPELARVREAQVEELLAFVDAVHDPANVALVVGDLNVDAEGRGPDGKAPPAAGAADAARLARTMHDAGFDDVWDLVGEGPGWTCDLLHAPLERFPADPDEPELCAEPAPAGDPEDHLVRIDHAYLQRPTPTQRLDVRVSRMRRRAFLRPDGAPERDVMATCSDHLGLHLELEVGPRS